MLYTHVHRGVIKTILCICSAALSRTNAIAIIALRLRLKLCRLRKCKLSPTNFGVSPWTRLKLSPKLRPLYETSL